MMLDETYDLPQLREYIREELGVRSWRLETLGNDGLDSSISGAVMMYSKRCPRQRFISLSPLQAGVNFYQLTPQEVGFGIFHVDFVTQNSAFGISGTRYGLIKNLTGVAPAVSGDGIGGDMTEFLMWRKSFHRVTSQTPQWRWDEEEFRLWVYNPPAYSVCAFAYLPRNLQQVRMVHKDLIRRMALASAKLKLGRARAKFDGSVQGPGGTTIQTDAKSLLDEGKAEMEACEKELYAVQPRAHPVWD